MTPNEYRKWIVGLQVDDDVDVVWWSLDRDGREQRLNIVVGTVAGRGKAMGFDVIAVRTGTDRIDSYDVAGPMDWDKLEERRDDMPFVAPPGLIRSSAPTSISYVPQPASRTQ